MATIGERLQEASIAFFMPVTLLINFSLFQYLLVVYYKRRCQYHGFLLLLCAFLGFAALIPFASANDERAGHLNDISETASVATFLIQITIVSRDVTKKMLIPSLRYMMLASELFTLFELLVLLINLLEVAGVDMHAFDGVDNIAENLSLAFIFVSRFAFLCMARGWRYLLDNKKLEITMYALFLTHEYPFQIFEAETDVSWEALQSVWHRLTMAMCISLTLKEKFRSSMLSNSNTKHKTTSHDAHFSEYDAGGAKGVSRIRFAVLSKIPAVKPHMSTGPSTKSVFTIRTSFSKAIHPAGEAQSAKNERSLASFNKAGGLPGAANKSMTHLRVGAHADK